MQSLFLLSLISSALPSARQSNSQQLFTRIWPEPARRWPSFLSSLGIHVLLVLLLPVLSDRLSDDSDREVWLRQERLMRTLRIRIPEHLYIASAGRTPPEAKRQIAPPTQASAPPQAAAGPSGRRRAAARRRRFDLPPVQRRVESSQSLIQPQYGPDLAPTKDLHLPEVFFWSPPPAVRIPQKPFVQPGHVTRPTQARLLDAAPKLELPTGLETGPPQAVTVLDPKLLAAFGDSMPIRTSYPDQPRARMGMSGDPLAGDPANLLSISSDPLPLREFMTAPPGNQIGQTPEGVLRGGDGGGDASGRGSGTGPGTSGRGAGSGLPGGTGGGNGSGSAPPSASTRSAALAATRIDHPAGGVVDVVVQSTDLEGFAESAGVLSGKPIYSVFLAVGAAKEWILQYCIPLGEDQAAEVNGAVVRLGSSSPLSAPYPRVTFRPPLHHAAGTHLMLHGFITPAGKFQELRLLGKGDPRTTGEAIAVLEEWEFRPATQDGSPVRVEILLAIPGE